MYNANRPARSDLPTTGQLLKSTGIAAAVGTVGTDLTTRLGTVGTAL